MSAAHLWALVAALELGCLLRGPWALVAACPFALAAGLRRWPPARRLLLVAGLLMLAGLGLTAGRAALQDAGPLVALAAEQRSGAMEAVVVAEPQASRIGAWTIVRVTRVDGSPTRARALLRLPDADEDPVPELGARVAFRAAPQALERDGFGAHLRRLGAGVEVRPRAALRVVGPPGRLLAATNAIRERVRRAAGRNLSPTDAALLTGLVTGDTRGLPQEAEERFTQAGLSHLVAVSGSNVALVLAGVTGVVAAAGLGARGRGRLGIAAVLWFVLLTRWEPSVLRAGLMAVLVLAGGLTGRGTEARHALGMAALLLLLADPLLAGQLGFLLSVAATAGVLVLGPAVAERIPGPSAWRRLAGAAIGAQAGVAPVLLTLPDGIPLAGVAANLVAVPAAAVASALGVAAALAAQVSEPLGGVLATLAWPALRTIVGTVAVAAGGPRLTAAGVTLPLLALLCMAIVLRRRAPRLALAGVLITGLVATLPGLVPPAGVAALTVTALDVGQGDAVLVEAPAADGSVARLLVDGGPEPGALAALRARRVRRLDAVVLTHPHADHTDGLPAVLRALDVGALIVGPRRLAGDTTRSAVQTYATARGRGVPVLAVAAGSRFALGAATVEVLGPPPTAALSDDVNDESVVLRVVAQGRVALLAGDAEVAAQDLLLRDPARLRADYLKVPHHGGATNHEGFLAAVGADVNVLSVGRDNSYGHPHPEIVAELAGSTLLRTDRDGTVSVALLPQGLRLLQARGPPSHAGDKCGRLRSLEPKDGGLWIPPPSRRCSPRSRPW